MQSLKHLYKNVHNFMNSVEEQKHGAFDSKNVQDINVDKMKR